MIRPDWSTAEAWSNRVVEAEYRWEEADRGWAAGHCYSLIQLSFREVFGLAIADYGPARDRQLNAALFDAGKRIPPWIDVSSKALQSPFERRPFDLVGFSIGGIDDHCGILVTPNMMLHCARRRGQAAVDPINRGGWGVLSGIYRHEALA